MTLLQVVAASQNRLAFHLTGHLRPPFMSRLPDETRRTVHFRTDTSSVAKTSSRSSRRQCKQAGGEFRLAAVR